MKKLIAAACLLTLSTTALYAVQSQPTVERQKLMKSMVSAGGGQYRMLSGRVPFDLAMAQAALKTFVEGSKLGPTLFPPESKGDETKALPVIWDEKANFVSLFEKLGTEATAAMTTITDEASYKANMSKVMGACDACHDKYRARS